MRENTVKSIWARGGVVVNGWLSIPSSFSAEVMAHQGFDSLVVDMQHGVVDYQTAVTMLQAISTTGVIPFARVPWNDPAHIMKILDAGAYGIICPMINSRKEAEQLVRTCKYAPKGYRSFGPVRASIYAGTDYAQHANDTLVVMPMIETKEAVENIDEILDVTGVDLCFVGPNDLHLALGYPAMFWSAEPRFVQAIERVKGACQQRGIPFGTLCKDAASAQARSEEGFRFIGLGSDAHFMLQFAGMQYGDLHGVSEPHETWCNTIQGHERLYHGSAVPRREAAAAASGTCDGAPAPPASPSQSQAFTFDPNAPEFDVDPFPTYQYMRENVPVYWWPEAQGWVVTRYHDVMTLLRAKRFSVEVKDWEHGPREQPDEQLTTHQVLAKHGLFWMPSADHRRVRKVLGPLFTPRAVEGTKAEYQYVVDDVLSALAGRETVDLVTDFTAPYPLRAITHLLGIPRHRQEEFIQFGSAVIDAFYPVISPEALRQQMEFLPQGVAMLEQMMEERRKSSSRDWFSQFIHAEEQGERLTPQEVISMVALMISAGCEPPRHLISFAVYDLLRHPEQLEILRSEPDLLRNAIDEVGRFDSFGKLNLPRFALEDLEIRGVRIRKGQQVFGVFASALRDPDVFPDADMFDIRRDQGQSLLYGDGLHVCLGTWLAKNMAEAAVGTLIRRFPTMRLIGEPTYMRNTFFRKMVSLPVRLV